MRRVRRALVVLDRLEEDFAVVLLLHRVAVGGIEDLLLDGAVDLDLGFDLAEELPAPVGAALGGLLELREETLHLLVVLLQQRDGVFSRSRLGHSWLLWMLTSPTPR